MNRYVEYLKKYEPMDSYILFLMSLTERPGPFNTHEVASMCGVSFKTVYSCLKRHQDLKKYFKGRI